VREAAIAVFRGVRRERTVPAHVYETAGTIILNVSATVLNFAGILLLSRLLGASGYGEYALAIAWASVLSIVAVLGLTPLVVRRVAEYHQARKLGLLRGLLRRTNEAVVLASVITMVAAGVVSWLIYRGQPELLYPIWIATLLVPLIALTSLRQAAMQGLGKVLLGRIPETLAAPALLILFAAVAWATLEHFTASWATVAQVAATFIAFCTGAVLLRRTLPAATSRTTTEYDMSSWRRSGVPLLLLNLVMAANQRLGTILLGALGTAAMAGVFNVAERATAFISFVMLAATYPLMPRVARLHASGDLTGLNRLVVLTARGVLLFALPTGLVLIVFGPQILHLFGEDFGGGATAIRILAIGEVANVLTGYGGLVLVMTGFEKDLTRCAALGAALNLGLSAVLIPSFDVPGAAVATATGVTFSNILMMWLAWRRLRIWTGVLPIGRLRPRT